MRLKDEFGMTNSVDPDQEQSDMEQSDLGLHCLHISVCFNI